MKIDKLIRKNEKGFTLVETMCALALLVIVITGFTTLVTTASRMNIKAAQLRTDYEQSLESIIKKDDLTEKSGAVHFKVDKKNAPGDLPSAESMTLSVNVKIQTTKTAIEFSTFSKQP